MKTSTHHKQNFGLYIILGCAMVRFCHPQEARIIEGPRPVNVSLNGEAILHCTAVGKFFTWWSNSTQINYEINTEKINDDHRQSTLRKNVTLADNNTNITCVVVSLNPPKQVTSNPALLLVQGLLEAVSNLTVVPINSTTVLISWSPPFTLEGVPILGYNVTITSSTSGENDTTNFSTNHSSIQYHLAQNVINLIITVVPINEAGVGLPACNSEVFPTPSPTGPTGNSNSNYLTTYTKSLPVDSTDVLSSSAIIDISTTMPPPNGTFKIGSLTILVIVAVCVAFIVVLVLIVFSVIAIKKTSKRHDKLEIMSDLEEVHVKVEEGTQSSTSSLPPALKTDDNHEKDSGIDTNTTSAPEPTEYTQANPVVDHVLLYQLSDKVSDQNSSNSHKVVVATYTTDLKSQEDLSTFPDHSYSNDISSEAVGSGNPPETAVNTAAVPVSAEGGDYTNTAYYTVSSSKPVDVRKSINPQTTGETNYPDTKKCPIQQEPVYHLAGNDGFMCTPGVAKDETSTQTMVASVMGLSQDQRSSLSDSQSECVHSTQKYEHLSSDGLDDKSMSLVNELLPEPRPPDKAHKRTSSTDDFKTEEVPTNEEREQIAQQLAHKWRLVGLQLGVDPAKLDQIASECDGDQSCCSVLLRKLSTGEVTASCPFTWRGVIETLDSNN